MVTSGAGEENSFDFTQDKLLIPSRWIPPTHANGELVEPERVKGIEPSYQLWKSCVLPLNYTRELAFSL